MRDTLSSRVKSVFSFLFNERSFVIVRDEDAGFNDLAELEVASADFDLKFTQDRGTTTISISPTRKQQWFDFDLIMALLDDSDLLDYLEFGEAAPFIRENYGRIAERFTCLRSAITVAELKHLHIQSLKARFPQLGDITPEQIWGNGPK